MRILIAPDKFKGSLTALEVAEAIAAGIRASAPIATELLPLADGGDGTVAAMCTALGGAVIDVEVTGPLGDPTSARMGRLPDERFVVEAASSSGLALIPAARLNPMRASTVGVGELIKYAEDAGATEIVVGVGGTASTDGGTGAATARGWRFLDARGRALRPGGGDLVNLARIDGTAARPSAAKVVAACDVTNPLTGEAGAATVFGPQKGATPQEVRRLDEGLTVLADRMRSDLGLDLAGLPRAGAGGGVAAGLHAFFGAQLIGGFDVVAGAVGLDRALARCDLVVTGEGRLDDQSLGGKVTAGVASAARAAGVPCAAICGDITLSQNQWEAAGFAAAGSLVQTVGRSLALSDPVASVQETVKGLLKTIRI